jgi:hypothetical protein
VVGAVVAGTLVTVDSLNGGSSTLAALALPADDTTETVAPPTAPDAPEVDLAGAATAGEEAAARDDFRVAVSVADTATGELAPGSNGEDTFNTASLAKLFLVVDMLERQRAGEIQLGARDLRLVHAALSSSSDPAMNALWTEYDGPAAISRVARSVGLEDTTSPEDPSQWGEVQTSARDMVKLLRHVQVELPAPDRDLVLRSMSDAPRIAGDGFDQGYGFLDGRSPVKQGWLCCLGSRGDMHSVAVVDGRFVVAVMTNEPMVESPRGYDAARESVNAAAGAVRQALGPTVDAR